METGMRLIHIKREHHCDAEKKSYFCEFFCEN